MSDPDNQLTSHVQGGAGWAIGFVRAKCNQLDKQLRARNNGRLPPRTFYWTIPNKAIKRIMLKVDVLTQSWFAKIIVGAAVPAGVLTLPRNVDNPNGWIAPFEDPDAMPPVVPPGTPNTGNDPNKYTIYQLQGKTLNAVRGEDFRQFTNNALVDWRSDTFTDPDTGEKTFEILHWHAASRYFPYMDRHSASDGTTGNYETHFYDRSGTIRVEGPGGNIRGVCLRNRGQTDELGNSLEEFLVATGQMATGYDIYKRGRQAAVDDDPMNPWVLIGNTGVFAFMGTGVVGTTGWPTVWEVPLHFNRAGTRACKIEMSRLNGSPDPGTPHLLEVTIDGDTVSATLTDVGTASITTFTEVQVNNDDPLTRNNTATQVISQLASPIAADFKIASDTEIGLITTDHVQTIDNTTDYARTLSEVIEPPPAFGSIVHEVYNQSIKRVRTETVTFNMDGGGGEGPYALGPLRMRANYGFQFNLTVDLTRNVFLQIENDPDFDISGSMTNFTLLVPEEESNADTRSQFIEPIFADIRYGTMIVKERLNVPETIDFNAGLDYPATSAGFPGLFTIPDAASPQTVGSVIKLPDTTDTIAVSEAVGDPRWAVWGHRNRFLNRTHIRAPGIDEVFEIVDEFYANDKYSGSPGIQQPEIYFALLSITTLVDKPEQDTTTVTPGSTGNFSVVNTADSIGVLTLSTNIGVLDRNGKLFYAVEIGGNDKMSGGDTVSFAFYEEPTPDWDYSSFFAYATEDPAAFIGMPANGTNGELANTTRPLFSPMVAVQRTTYTIPEE